MKEKYHLRASFRSLSRFLRDRPFNLKGGLWFRIFFFQNLTLDFMTKNLNQIIFFFLHQNQNIFFSNIGNQNIFKLNGRSLISLLNSELNQTLSYSLIVTSFWGTRFLIISINVFVNV